MAWSQLPADLGCITPPHTIANIMELKNRQVFLPHPVLVVYICLYSFVECCQIWRWNTVFFLCLSCTHWPVGSTEEKRPFGISATALVVVVMFLFSVWKVPLGEYYKAWWPHRCLELCGEVKIFRELNSWPSSPLLVHWDTMTFSPHIIQAIKSDVVYRMGSMQSRNEKCVQNFCQKTSEEYIT